MFKRIHSNRDPRDTLLSELKKEFRPYVSKAGNGFKSIASSHPKLLFVVMVINIVLSVALSFTVFRHKAPPSKAPPKSIISPLSGGFGQLMKTGEAIRQTALLKKQVDSLSAKKTLSSKDSARLDSALDKLQVLTKSFNSTHSP